MEDFTKRSKEFNKGFLLLQQKYKVAIYAANVVLKNGEVAPLVRIADQNNTAPESEMILTDEKKV